MNIDKALSLGKNDTDGIIVPHDGPVVYEKYFAVLTETRRHAAMAVTKSFIEARFAVRAGHKASPLGCNVMGDSNGQQKTVASAMTERVGDARLRVLIVGAGIGGATLGALLAQRGERPVLIDQTPPRLRAGARS